MAMIFLKLIILLGIQKSQYERTQQCVGYNGNFTYEPM